MIGFFQSSEFQENSPVVSSIPKCGACGLFQSGCTSPKMPVTGEGRLGILIVGDFPDKIDDQKNTQFVGLAGRFLRQKLYDIGIDLDRDCWKTNSLICRTKNGKSPTNSEIDFCRPNLKNTIDKLKPRLIMPLGATAIRSVLGPYWHEDIGAITKWTGWKIPSQWWNAWVCPNYHPGDVLASDEWPNRQDSGNVLKVWFERILAQSVALQGRPWGTVPNYAGDVRIAMNPDEAAGWIYQRLSNGGVFAFDYETNMLKPDSSDAEIVSCSVCWNGKETIAYPWAGAAIRATGELACSPHPKVAAHSKFEDRWTRRFFGHGVNNVIWDVVLDAHVLDNRDGITSVKTQAFLRLGQLDWASKIKPFLIGDGGKEKNRIRECNLRALLKYNGIDSLVEYLIAVDQRKELKSLLN